MSIHALRRERLPALSCGLPSNQLKNIFLARWETIEELCLCFPHATLQMKQKPGRRSPHVTGRSVTTLYQGWVGSPSELATFTFHHAVVGFVGRSMWSTLISPLPIQDLLEVLPKIAARNPFFLKN